MLEVEDVWVSYGSVEAVRGISVQAHPGKITLVLGANGAGKTSLLRSIAGLVPMKKGRVMMDQKDITGSRPHRIARQGLTMVPEGRQVFGPLTVQENLELGAYTRSKAEQRETLQQVFEMFPILSDRREKAAGLLSGGEQQMLAFGRALMARPRVVLMDEPSMGLAPAIVESVLSTARRIADEGIAVLMVEQNAEAGLEVADSVVAVEHGEVAFEGSAADALSQAAVLRAFLGESALTE